MYKCILCTALVQQSHCVCSVDRRVELLLLSWITQKECHCLPTLPLPFSFLLLLKGLCDEMNIFPEDLIKKLIMAKK
jgi:hypothetical protein